MDGSDLLLSDPVTGRNTPDDPSLNARLERSLNDLREVPLNLGVRQMAVGIPPKIFIKI
jgi:hypothetical protein